MHGVLNGGGPWWIFGCHLARFWHQSAQVWCTFVILGGEKGLARGREKDLAHGREKDLAHRAKLKGRKSPLNKRGTQGTKIALEQKRNSRDENRPWAKEELRGRKTALESNMGHCWRAGRCTMHSFFVYKDGWGPNLGPGRAPSHPWAMSHEPLTIDNLFIN